MENKNVIQYSFRDLDIQRMREYTVSRSNDLISKMRNTLTLQENKCVLFLISKIKPGDTGNQEYVFSIREFMQVCGMRTKNTTYFVRTLTGLLEKVFWIKIDEDMVSARWLDRCIYNVNAGYLRIRFDEKLLPFLFNLRNRFSQFKLIYALPMKSKYSIALYDVLNSNLTAYQDHIYVVYELEDLKELLGAKNYKNWTHVKQKVLEPAFKEINAYSDMKFIYTPIKTCRSVTSIRFDVTKKTEEEKYNTKIENHGILDGEIVREKDIKPEKEIIIYDVGSETRQGHEDKLTQLFVEHYGESENNLRAFSKLFEKYEINEIERALYKSIDLSKDEPMIFMKNELDQHYSVIG